MTVRSGIGGLVILGMAAWAPAHAQEACPSSCVALLTGPLSCGTAPARDSATAAPSIARATYDLAAGTGRVSADSRSETAPRHAAVAAHDRYVVTGLAGPTTVTARLDFRVVLRSSCEYFQCSYAWAHVGLAAQGRTAVFDRASYDLSQNVDLRSQLELPLDIVPDAPFELAFELEADAEFTTTNANTLVTAALSFPDLPAGVHVASCQGYNGGTVPAVPGSWGRVKVSYR